MWLDGTFKWFHARLVLVSRHALAHVQGVLFLFFGAAVVVTQNSPVDYVA